MKKQRIMGIDLGERKTGLAVCESKLAEPLRVIRHKSIQELVSKLKRITEEEGIEKVVVGVSEGEMGEKQKAFGLVLSDELKLPVEFGDETLSTADAQAKAIESGKGQKKRREMEDAYAAAVMLQGWVDENL